MAVLCHAGKLSVGPNACVVSQVHRKLWPLAGAVVGVLNTSACANVGTTLYLLIPNCPTQRMIVPAISCTRAVAPGTSGD